VLLLEAPSVGAVICSEPSGSIEMTSGHSSSARQPISPSAIGLISEIGSGVASRQQAVKNTAVVSALVRQSAIAQAAVAAVVTQTTESVSRRYQDNVFTDQI
jgi:hypothetical protein